MFRVSTKDRKFIEEVEYRGWKIRVADWLHLSNPDDPSKPIVGQVFKCYVSEEPSVLCPLVSINHVNSCHRARKGQQGVTVCWYYRPEQTIHPAHRQFWQHEVFKTSHFADHPLDDIIEKIACQFTARHIRGRPRPPFWYPGFPLYVCDSRYNDRERIFVKIKNWNSCVPEEVRKSKDFMPIYPFETSVFPRRFPSPFIGGGTVRGTGGIGDAVERGEGDKLEGGGTGRKKVRKTAPGPTDYGGPNKGVYVGAPVQAQAASFNIPMTTNSSYLQPNPVHAPAYNQPQRSASTLVHEDRSMLTAAGGLQLLGAQNVLTEKLPPETGTALNQDNSTELTTDCSETFRPRPRNK
jgi:chromatin structure-remodeling complex subunit RSC1/2